MGWVAHSNALREQGIAWRCNCTALNAQLGKNGQGTAAGWIGHCSLCSGQAIEQQAGMQQIAGSSMLVVMVHMAVQGFGLQRVPMLNAVGKTCPLRDQNGQRDQHVLEPAGAHWGDHFEGLRLK